LLSNSIASEKMHFHPSLPLLPLFSHSLLHASNTTTTSSSRLTTPLHLAVPRSPRATSF
jgi:hypothetical protein